MNEVILDTSPEAAKFVENISGWVSRDGLFFGKNEDAARYQGCSHRACSECGSPAPKGYTACSSCREKKAEARYEKLERAEWDEKGALYSEVADYMEEENEQTLAPVSLRLVG